MRPSCGRSVFRPLAERRAAGRRNNAVRLYGEQHAAFLAAHPAPLPVPEPDLAAPVEFFRRNQNGATRIVSDINRL